MFERFNEAARQVLFFARYDTSRIASKCIDAEHVLANSDPRGKLGRGIQPQRFACSRYRICRHNRSSAYDSRWPVILLCAPTGGGVVAGLRAPPRLSVLCVETSPETGLDFFRSADVVMVTAPPSS
jgi:hypothetical protein